MADLVRGVGAYLGAMTTYTTPHFATGLPDRNVRSDVRQSRRPATAATYRTAGVSNEAATYADGPRPTGSPVPPRGVPKAAIGALGAALVGGVALAIVLMAPSNKVDQARDARPDRPGDGPERRGAEVGRFDDAAVNS